MEKTVMIIIAVVAVLIIIGVIVALKNKSSADGVDTGPQAHADSASDSAQKAADVSAAAASAAASAPTPEQAAAATQQAVAAGAVAQQAAASSAQTAQQVSSAVPIPNVDCELNDWGVWGPCIADSNGKYFKTKLRTIKVQPSGNGKACETLVDKVSCVPDVDCVLNDWGGYDPCTADSDGKYFKTRRTTMKVQPSGNGKPCESLVDKVPCTPLATTTSPGTISDGPCAGFKLDSAPSAANPIPLACHQMIWSSVCGIPLNEKDWAPNYRTFPATTPAWLLKDTYDRAVHPTWKSHCNPVAVPASCAGYTAGSTAKPIPLQCHQDIWRKYCSKPLAESDWAPNYRSLPAVTVDWLNSDAISRSKDQKWTSRCRNDH